ncbi:MAG TPA: response regulator [Pyrinomonadaceae bacterium]|jgi:two-component system KDP operon response regulator KdpE
MRLPDRYRILYADDNEDSCALVNMMCKSSNIEVVTINTIAEAWQMAQSGRFDLYLLDSKFPDGDGLELCRRLREYDSRTPILIYSGKAFETDKRNGLAAGANDYLTKPYQGDLCATIRQNIEQTIKMVRQPETITA